MIWLVEQEARYREQLRHSFEEAHIAHRLFVDGLSCKVALEALLQRSWQKSPSLDSGLIGPSEEALLPPVKQGTWAERSEQLASQLEVSSDSSSQLAGKGYLIQAGDSSLEAKDASIRALSAQKIEALGRLDRLIKPDLIVMELILPGMDGLHLLAYIKSLDGLKDIPILMTSGRQEQRDKFRAFDLGVDDYLEKPYTMRELQARIRAVLRRCQLHLSQDSIVLGELSIDRESQSAQLSGRDLGLTYKE